MRVFYCLFLAILLSCSDPEPIPFPEVESCASIIIDSEMFNDTDGFVLPRISEYNLEGSCLSATILAVDCNGFNDIDMVSDGVFDESTPPQLTFVLMQKSAPSCDILHYVERSFDLSELANLIEGEVILRDRGDQDISIAYQN